MVPPGVVTRRTSGVGVRDGMMIEVGGEGVGWRQRSWRQGRHIMSLEQKQMRVCIDIFEMNRLMSEVSLFIGERPIPLYHIRVRVPSVNGCGLGKGYGYLSRAKQLNSFFKKMADEREHLKDRLHMEDDLILCVLQLAAMEHAYGTTLLHHAMRMYLKNHGQCWCNLFAQHTFRTRVARKKEEVAKVYCEHCDLLYCTWDSKPKLIPRHDQLDREMAQWIDSMFMPPPETATLTDEAGKPVGM